MESIRAKSVGVILLIAACADLSGCTTAGELPASGAYGGGYGSFSLTLATNTNYVLKYYRDDTDYSLLEFESMDHPGTTYDIALNWYPAMGVRQAFGYVPAGHYRLSKISASMTDYIGPFGSSGTTGYVEFNDSFPSFVVEPGVHTDLGALIVEFNPAAADKALVGWIPADADASAVIDARMQQHAPMPVIRQASLSRGDGSDEWVVSHSEDNPAPSGDIRAYPTGEIIIPGHLGRILYRDREKHWHVLSTGHMAYVRDAGLLDDGRIAALLANGRFLLSDADHQHWQQFTTPDALDAPDRLGVVSGTVVVIGGRAHWEESDAKSEHPVKREGRAIYAVDAIPGRWRLIERLADADRIAFDSEKVYLFGSVPATRLLRDDALLVTDVQSGKTTSRTIPAGILFPLGGGLLTAYDDYSDGSPGLSDFEQFVSRDAGRTWQRIASANDATGRLHLNGPMFPLSSPGSAVSYGRYHNVITGADTYGYFLSKDGGASWAPLSSASQGCAFVGRVAFIAGAIWQACDEGTVLSLDPLTGAVETERRMSEETR